ncbi:GntR family transcriptional regulator [Rhizobium sp. GN54]|uniref:GntR family transcriptional regulator n=1 Tax=Rhizobium sp. GN54 TaxID=2898150 RepID=UPI001E4DBEC4|nr:GntR family transcriptional regulator [Rhizobium sp. GN54]MCD2184637.1 GntR family transcriptional regulator [Rhizobium sp. GN54]
MDSETTRAQLAQRHSIGDDVYEALVSDLIALRIPPGERMSVDALAREFGVSQTPVRAALIRLESEGLVVKKFNSGYSAAPMPSSARFRDVYAMRLLVEPEAAALATIQQTTETCLQLRALCEEMKQLVEGDTRANYGRFALLDGQFHALIAHSCANEVIAETLERLYAHMHLFRLRYHSAVAEEAVKEHLAILTAMEMGDVEAARAAMAAHITSSRARMEPFYQIID